MQALKSKAFRAALVAGAVIAAVVALGADRKWG